MNAMARSTATATGRIVCVTICSAIAAEPSPEPTPVRDSSSLPEVTPCPASAFLTKPGSFSSAPSSPPATDVPAASI